MLLPLLRSQKYIQSANWADRPTGATHQLIHWRKNFYRGTQPLYASQADSLGIKDLDPFPWLDIAPNPRSKGKIIVARTARYNNPKFPWREILPKYRYQILFVGMEEERRNLERVTGTRIEHYKIKNFLEMAELIAGSECLISNQTCAYWLAAGMGHPLIQETENIRRIHDSMVPRDNAFYSLDGEFPSTLPEKRKWIWSDWEI